MPNSDNRTPPLICETLRNLRAATCLLAIDRTNLVDQLPAHADTFESDPTRKRLVAAGLALELFDQNSAGIVSCSPALRSVLRNPLERRTLVSILEHQLSYLLNVRDWKALGSLRPADQLTSEPEAYYGFLKGVDASHQAHASWFAALPELSAFASLVDIGGGLGTFSRAWVHSRPSRQATVLDLPRLQHLFWDHHGNESDRISFHGIDLRHEHLPRVRGDLYLVANVLHLFANWKTILTKIVQTTQPGATIAILEALPTGTPGILFDLQVHLRSGCLGGLLPADELSDHLAHLGCHHRAVLRSTDAHDPFERSYNLYLGITPDVRTDDS